MATIAIDLGGTNIRAARIEDRKVCQQAAVSCNARGTEKEVIEQLCSLIDEVNDPTVECIGIGVPSVVDHTTGTVFNVQNIPAWKEVPLKAILEARYHIPVAVDNDVNCYVLGELHFGCGKNYHNIVGITLGTGVGAGIITDGKLYRGHNTGAGEIGCLPYLDADYEQYCSSQLFSRLGTSGYDLAQRMAAADEAAKAIWQQFGYHLGKLLQVILFTYDPEAIIIGGGIAASAPHFEAAMHASLRENFPYQHEIEKLHIHFSTLENSNLLGASQL